MLPPPAPLKDHTIYFNKALYQWVHVKVIEQELDIPPPPAPLRDHTIYFNKELYQWIFVKVNNF